METQEYEIFIRATVNSSFSKKELEHRLVASLYDVDTEEKISDGDDERFEVIDYVSTNAYPEKIIKKQMLTIFGNYRSKIIEDLFDLVKKTPSKNVMLNNNHTELKIEDNGCICRYRYEKLSIKNNSLLVHYFSGKRVNPSRFEQYTDDILLFSLDEIYEIINYIQDDVK